MKRLFLFSVFSIISLVVSTKVQAASKNESYFQLKVYHFTTAAQEATIDSFLQYHYLPYLHSSKLNNIGVFKAIANDTAADKKIYVFIPFKSLKEWEQFSERSIENTVSGDAAYVNAAYNQPAYTRFETILLKAFPLMPPMAASKLTAPKSERVYELRSYEGPTEKYYKNKVKMFNEGGEITLFDRLGFNAVFYSEVVAGPKMPNLMYMTSFENMKSREEHWKAFGSDPVWKKLVSDPQYQHNVSHSDIIFLRPTEFSDL
ncbi:MAG: family containing protein [Segetibacter sp.]|nr:family containing protein [Segetibacter sp.]